MCHLTAGQTILFICSLRITHKQAQIHTSYYPHITLINLYALSDTYLNDTLQHNNYYYTHIILFYCPVQSHSRNDKLLSDYHRIDNAYQLNYRIYCQLTIIPGAQYQQLCAECTSSLQLVWSQQEQSNQHTFPYGFTHKHLTFNPFTSDHWKFSTVIAYKPVQAGGETVLNVGCQLAF